MAELCCFAESDCGESCRTVFILQSQITAKVSELCFAESDYGESFRTVFCRVRLRRKFQNCVLQSQTTAKAAELCFVLLSQATAKVAELCLFCSQTTAKVAELCMFFRVKLRRNLQNCVCFAESNYGESCTNTTDCVSSFACDATHTCSEHVHRQTDRPVSYTHLTLPTSSYV